MDEKSVQDNNSCIYIYIIYNNTYSYYCMHNGPSMMQCLSLHVPRTTPHNKQVKSKIIKEIVETRVYIYLDVYTCSEVYI